MLYFPKADRINAAEGRGARDTGLVCILVCLRRRTGAEVRVCKSIPDDFSAEDADEELLEKYFNRGLKAGEISGAVDVSEEACLKNGFFRADV